MLVDDLDRFARKYESYLGAGPVRDGSAWRFDFSLVGRTSDLAAQRARLDAAGITVREVHRRLLVPAEQACGLAVLFES